MPKAILIPCRRMGQVIRINDHLSDLEVEERLDRVCEAIKKKKAAQLEYLKTAPIITSADFDLASRLEDDEAMDLIHDNLSSLGMPMPVLGIIPPLPSEAEIRRAMAQTEEVNDMIRRAREAIQHFNPRKEE